MANLHTVAQLKDSVGGILSGLDLTNVQDLNGALERAAGVLLQKADVPEAMGIQNINLYNGVYDYAVDTRIFQTDIVDIRPQGISRLPWNYSGKTTQERFDRTKSIYTSATQATFQYTLGVPTIRIISPTPTTKVNIDNCTAVGNWVASGTASGLTQDTTNYYQPSGSLRFNLTSGAGILTETLSSSLSISTYQNVGVVFLAIEIPAGSTASNLTNIQLKLGSDASNYNSVTQTTGFVSSFTDGQWMLIPFDMSTASTVGTPNWSAIKYVQLTFNTTGSFTNFRIGALFDALPSPNQIIYQTNAIFIPTGTTTPTTTITADTDTIVFNQAAYTIYLYEAALSILENTSGGMGDAMTARLEAKLNGARARNGQVITQGLYDLYRGDNPSQQIRLLDSYYETGSGGWMGWGSAGGTN